MVSRPKKLVAQFGKLYFWLSLQLLWSYCRGFIQQFNQFKRPQNNMFKLFVGFEMINKRTALFILFIFFPRNWWKDFCSKSNINRKLHKFNRLTVFPQFSPFLDKAPETSHPSIFAYRSIITYNCNFPQGFQSQEEMQIPPTPTPTPTSW